MKYLGIDYGTRRTGVAISPDSRVAVVKEVIHTTSQNKTIERIKQIVAEDGIECIVVGLPVSMQNNPTEMTEKAKLFVEKLRNHVSIPVQTIDERFTTDMAEKLLRGIKHEERDQVSAQILLQNFLDSLSAAS
jgi:putative Holliday junction resolvase